MPHPSEKEMQQLSGATMPRLGSQPVIRGVNTIAVELGGVGSGRGQSQGGAESGRGRSQGGGGVSEGEGEIGMSGGM